MKGHRLRPGDLGGSGCAGCLTSQFPALEVRGVAEKRPISAPRDLGPAGRRFWREIQGTFELDVAETLVLRECCCLVDTMADLKAVVAAAGVMDTGSKKQDRVHPAVVELRAQRLALARLLAALQLPTEAEDGGVSIPEPMTIRNRKAAAARWGRSAEARAFYRSNSGPPPA